MNEKEFMEKLNRLTNDKYACLRVCSVDVMLQDAMKSNSKKLEKINVILLFLVPYENYTELMTPENKAEIAAAVKSILPPRADCEIRYKKSYSTVGDVLEATLAFVSENYPLIKTQMTTDGLSVRKKPDGVEVTFTFEPIFEGMVKETNFIAKVKAELERNFSGEFFVTVNYLAENIIKSEEEIKPRNEILADKNEVKFVRLTEGAPLFGKFVGEVAHTIKSRISQNGNFETICGEIKSFRAGISKKGKKYYIIKITDKTAEINVKFFGRSDKDTPLDTLKEGLEVVCTGNIVEERENEEYPTKFKVRFMNLSGLDLCKVDYDSITQGKAYRKLPEHYTRVFPETISDPFENEMNAALFGKMTTSPYFADELIVFDLETTGLNPDSDYIIEIGAVLVKNGLIAEQFQTFVKPPIPLPQKIIELTHITDEMLSDAPDIQDVLGDFYKFAYGRKLIAYNSAFDVSFIKRVGEDYRYKFDNPSEDALEMAKKAEPNGKHKLENMCEKYEIFYPVKHRAVGDAMVTAELVKRLKNAGKC